MWFFRRIWTIASDERGSLRGNRNNKKTDIKEKKQNFGDTNVRNRSGELKTHMVYQRLEMQRRTTSNLKVER